MPWNDDSDIRALRMAYNVAVTANCESRRVLTEALMRGEAARPELIEADAQARHLKELARRKLHAAMARAVDTASAAPNKPEP